ncbi:hypothetical protein AALA44_09365 [Enterococcus ratti]|uniref:hypothetical protein n=1 Tax=Enterococcus ratti TaxID=150033 RepID=UPI0035130132
METKVAISDKIVYHIPFVIRGDEEAALLKENVFQIEMRNKNKQTLNRSMEFQKNFCITAQESKKCTKEQSSSWSFGLITISLHYSYYL